MKKYLICLLGAIILMNTQFGCQSAKAGDSDAYHAMDVGSSMEVVYSYKEFDGMQYVVFGGYYQGTTVVNLTKDKLEVELLQLQIAKLKAEKP